MPKALYTQDGHVTDSLIEADGGVTILTAATPQSGVRFTEMDVILSPAVQINVFNAGSVNNNNLTGRAGAYTVYIAGGSAAKVVNNDIYGINTYTIYSVSTYADISENILRAGTGVAAGLGEVAACLYVTGAYSKICRNKLIEPAGYGIVLDGADDSEVSSNTFYGAYIYSGSAIHLLDVDEPYVYDNVYHDIS